MKSLHSLLAGALLAISAVSQANTLGPVFTKVTGTGSYDDGSIYIFFPEAISSCNDIGRLDLAANNPSRDQMLAVALTSLSADFTVVVRPGSCASGQPVFGPDGDSYMYIAQ